MFSTVIHTGVFEDLQSVPIDNVAAAIDCFDKLTVEALKASYERIRRLKCVQKTDRPGPADGNIEMTTSFIVARDSDLTLEEIAREMGKLNATVPSHQWPDVVAVLSKGIINYTAQVPGTNRSGDFFLPTVSAAKSPLAPSLHIQKVIRATGELTFNKVASLIMLRVAIYQPGVHIPSYKELIADIPSHGVATEPYQFNLANTLVAMTKDQAIASQLPQDTFHIVSGKKTLGSVQYQKWQDGGVLIVRGQFPIDLFLVFLKQAVPELPLDQAQYFRSPGLQVSFVLPINEWQFAQALHRFDRSSSNMSIRRETSKLLVQQVGNEGTASPYVARLMMGMMTLRDVVYESEVNRNHFDDLYDVVLSGIRNARDLSDEISSRWMQHQSKVHSGAAVRIEGRRVHISESIDRALRRDLEGFLNTAHRTIKTSLQNLTKDLGMDIGFLFQKEPAFQAGIARTRSTDTELANYLIVARTWSEPLALVRNNLEHGTIPSPAVSYDLNSSPVQAREPQFEGKAITQFTSDVLDRISCFVEEITVFCLQKKLPKSFAITEVPLGEREPSAPERFRLTVTPGGMKPWTLSPHGKKFTEA